MFTRLAIPAALAVVVGAVVVQSSNKDKGAAPAAAPKTLSPEGLPVLNRWFALGSGCRAKDDLAGDVSMELLPEDPARPNTFRARFHLDQYRLDPSLLTDKSLLKFARECSVRLNINPPQGKRVTRVTAKTGMGVDKGVGTKLTVLNELLIGNTTLGRQQTVFSADEALLSKDVTVSLAPGSTPSEQFPELTCAEPKIIGFNYTWLAERSSPGEDVRVRVAGDKTLEIEAELSDCPKP